MAPGFLIELIIFFKHGVVKEEVRLFKLFDSVFINLFHNFTSDSLNYFLHQTFLLLLQWRHKADFLKMLH